MPRIDIELTSARPDGTWTWRAAGARQPKGTLEASLLFPEAKVGDVVRAECEVDLDGTRVTALVPLRPKRGPADRLPILGSGRDELPVTQDGRAPREGDRDRPRRDRDRRPGDERRGPDDRRDRPDDRSGPGRPGAARRPGGRPPVEPGSRPERAGGRPDGGPGRAAGTGPRRDARSSADRSPGPRSPGPRSPGDRSPGDRTRPRRDREGDRERGPRDRGLGDRTEQPRRPRAEQPRRPRAEGSPPPARPRPKRLQPGRKHRDAVLAGLPPEQRPVAEQVLRGGIPSVRQAVDEQNARARQVGEPEVRADALVVLAEGLLPRLREAEWRDRAEAAVDDADSIGLRDLRALVAGSDAAGRDEDSRALVGRLREALERRVALEQEAWLGEIRHSLAEGRVVRALRVSGRPPEPGVRFPPELADELSGAAGEAMTPETTPDRWVALLDAVVSSPVRRTVAPRGLPAERGEDLERALRLAAPRVPALGALLGGPRPPGARRPLPPRPDSPRPDSPRPDSPRPASPRPGSSAPSRQPRPPRPPRPASPPPAPAAEGAPASPPPAPAAIADEPSVDADVDAAAPVQDVSADAATAGSGDDGDDAVLVEELG